MDCDDVGDRAAAVVAGVCCAEAAELALTSAAEVADRLQVEWGRTALQDRLCAHRGSRLTFRLPGMEAVVGRVDAVEADWLRISTAHGPCYLALDKIDSVEGLSRIPGQSAGSTARRWTALLRQLHQARRPITVVTAAGHRITGSVVRVGRDHLDLELAEQTRSDSCLTITTRAIAAIRAH